MSLPGYGQVPSTSLYASDADDGTAPGWSGFLAGSPGAAVLAGTDAWNDGDGVYVFLGGTPADLPGFAAALTRWLPMFSPRCRPRLLWIVDPDADPRFWQAVGWYAQRSLGGAWTLWGRNGFTLGTYRVELAEGIGLSLGANGIAVGAGASSFCGPGAVCQVSGSSHIQLDGAGAGTWHGTMALPGAALSGLGIGLRFAHRASDDGADARIASLFMPVFTGAGSDLPMNLAWDPCAAHGERTRLRVAGNAPALASLLCTRNGHPITLTPVPGTAPQRPGGFRFGRTPVQMGQSAACTYHLTPDGAFDLGVADPVPGDALLVSPWGEEAIALDPAGTRLHFAAGRPAFAPWVGATGVLPSSGPALDASATTAWVAVLPTSATSLAYLTRADQTLVDGESEWIPAAPVATATVPVADNPLTPFPMGVFTGLAVADQAVARRLDTATFAPLRQARLATGPVGPNARAVASRPAAGTGPLGMVGLWEGTPPNLVGVVLANLPDATVSQSVTIAITGQDLRAALLADQAFVVIADGQTFATQATCSAPSLTVGDWRVGVDPSTWPTVGSASPPLLIWKYASRSLEALAADTSTWGWSAAAQSGGSLQATWIALNRCIAQAKASDPASPQGRFYREIAARSDWQGALLLNPPVSLDDDGPDALLFLTAGSIENLAAHHVACGPTPIISGTSLGRTPLSGLVDIEDEVPLVPEQTVPYACKTRRLRVEFADGRLADFDSTIDLAVNQLFDVPVTRNDPTVGNNLLLAGSLQRTGGIPGCSYVLAGANRFALLRSALASVDITAMRTASQSLATANDGSRTGTIVFSLDGRMRFTAFAAFDPFGYGCRPGASPDQPGDGWLSFRNLQLRLSFPIASGSAALVQHWSADATAIVLDLPGSRPRPDSLVARFPVRPLRLIADGGQTPQAMGYAAIAAPIAQQPLTGTWHGLVLELDLGSLGALAAGVGIRAEVLAAWGPGDEVDNLPLYLGLKLASTTVRGGHLPLQGVFDLGFSSLAFTCQRDAHNRVVYQMRLAGFALSLLGMRVPPGQADLCLFADLADDGTPSVRLGWIGAYRPPQAQARPTAAQARDEQQAAMTWPERARRLGRIPEGP